MKYIKQTICTLAASFAAVSAVYMTDADVIRCEETYNVLLRAETVEVDINDIPDNREVEVGVWIENNPGFLGIWFPIEIDGRLSYDQYMPFDYDYNNLCGGYRLFENNNPVLRIEMSKIDLNNLYNENNKLINLKLTLPENVNINDFYQVNFRDYISDSNGEGKPSFRRENSFDSYFGSENFQPFINGGIRIIGQESVPEPPQQSESPEQPAPQENNNTPAPVPENNQPPVQNNEQQPVQSSETAAPVSNVQTTSSVTTTTQVITTTPVTSSVTSTENITFTTTSETLKDTSTTTVLTSETTVTETTVYENEKKSGIPFIIAAVTAAAALVIGIIVKIKKKENTSDK